MRKMHVILFLAVLLIISFINLSVILTDFGPKIANAAGGGGCNEGWREVCCGESCPGGEDYCKGDGPYKCCK